MFSMSQCDDAGWFCSGLNKHLQLMKVVLLLAFIFVPLAPNVQAFEFHAGSINWIPCSAQQTTFF